MKSCFVGAYISILVSQGPPTASQSAFKAASVFLFPQRAPGDIVKQFTFLVMDMTWTFLHVLFNRAHCQMVFGVRVLNNELPPPTVTILFKWSWAVLEHIPLWNRLLLFSSLSQKARHFTGVPIPFLHSDKTAIILWTFLFTQPGEKGKVKKKEEEDVERFLPWGEPGLTSVWRAFLWAVKRSLTFYQMEAHSCVLLE